jgi:hypothetical protein
VAAIKGNAHDIHHLVNEGGRTINGGVSEKGEFLWLCLMADALLVAEMVDAIPIDDGKAFKFGR